MMKTHKPRRAVQQGYTPEQDDELLNHLRSYNVWDSIAMTTDQGWVQSIRMFGNANIGYLDRSNLQMPGQVTPPGWFFCTNWYARTNIPSQAPALQAGFDLLCQHSHFALVIGARPTWRANLFDLLRSWRVDVESHRVTTPLWPQVVPLRQNVSVVADFFSSGSWSPADFVSLLSSDYQPWSNSRPMIFVHLEGLLLPEWGPYDGTDDDREAHWRRICGRIVRLITRSSREAKTTCEHVANWIGSLVSDAKDQDEATQLQAIADGVREQRFSTKKKE